MISEEKGGCDGKEQRAGYSGLSLHSCAHARFPRRMVATLTHVSRKRWILHKRCRTLVKLLAERMEAMPSSNLHSSSLREEILRLLTLRQTLSASGAGTAAQHKQLDTTIKRLLAAARKRGEVCGCHEACTDIAWGPSGGRA